MSRRSAPKAAIASFFIRIISNIISKRKRVMLLLPTAVGLRLKKNKDYFVADGAQRNNASYVMFYREKGLSNHA